MIFQNSVHMTKLACHLRKKEELCYSVPMSNTLLSIPYTTTPMTCYYTHNCSFEQVHPLIMSAVRLTS